MQERCLVGFDGNLVKTVRGVDNGELCWRKEAGSGGDAGIGGGGDVVVSGGAGVPGLCGQLPRPKGRSLRRNPKKPG